MKFTNEDYQVIIKKIKDYKENNLQTWEDYKKQVIKENQYNVLENRLAWDLWNGLRIYNDIEMKIPGTCDFKYHDAHIQTAILKACKELNMF